MPDYQKGEWTALREACNVNQQPREEKEREAWDRMYKQLLAHRETHGDFVISIEDNKSLTTWMLYQRQRAREGILPDERRKKLESINFVFQYNNAKRTETSFTAKQDQQWHARYDQLAELANSHGRCLVPFKYDANCPIGKCRSSAKTS
jgi:isopenicillin N synthase-like dioxygenase